MTRDLNKQSDYISSSNDSSIDKITLREEFVMQEGEVNLSAQRVLKKLESVGVVFEDFSTSGALFKMLEGRIGRISKNLSVITSMDPGISYRICLIGKNGAPNQYQEKINEIKSILYEEGLRLRENLRQRYRVNEDNSI